MFRRRRIRKLQEELMSGPKSEKKIAASELGKQKDNSGVGVLLTVMVSGDYYAREAAWDALQELNSAWYLSSEAKSCVPILMKAFQSDRFDPKRVLFALELISHDCDEILDSTASLLFEDSSLPRSEKNLAAHMLHRRGWQPKSDGQRAYLAIYRKDWDVAASLGKAAMEPLEEVFIFPKLTVCPYEEYELLELIEALRRVGGTEVTKPLAKAMQHGYRSVRESAVAALESLDWQPQDPVLKARYAIERKDWAALISLGAVAEQPLIDTIFHGLYGPPIDIMEKTIGSDSTIRILISKLDELTGMEPLIHKMKNHIVKILQHSPSEVSIEHLHTLASLRAGFSRTEMTWSEFGDEVRTIEERVWVEIDCTDVHQLANNELQKRL